MNKYRISKFVSGLYDVSVRLSLFSSIYALGEWYSDRKHNGKSPVYHLCKLLRGRLSQVISDKLADCLSESVINNFPRHKIRIDLSDGD